MPPEDGLSFISFAFEQEEDSLLFQRWVNGYQDLGFAEFKERLKPKPQKPDEEVITDVENILVAFDRGKEVVR